MSKPSSNVVQLTPRRRAFGLRQLLDEVHVLIGSFPDLRDAFDADELPLAFILKRDSRRSERQLKVPKRMPASASGGRRMKPNRAGRRAGRRKQLSDD
jgi:hypothetical protein